MCLESNLIKHVQVLKDYFKDLSIFQNYQEMLIRKYKKSKFLLYVQLSIEFVKQVFSFPREKPRKRKGSTKIRTSIRIIEKRSQKGAKTFKNDVILIQTRKFVASLAYLTFTLHIHAHKLELLYYECRHY